MLVCYDLLCFFFRNSTKSATVQCVQYLLSHHMKNKSLIKKDDLMKTVFKGRGIGKNYDRVIQDVENTLKNVFIIIFFLTIFYTVFLFLLILQLILGFWINYIIRQR